MYAEWGEVRYLEVFGLARYGENGELTEEVYPLLTACSRLGIWDWGRGKVCKEGTEMIRKADETEIVWQKMNAHSIRPTGSHQCTNRMEDAESVQNTSQYSCGDTGIAYVSAFNVRSLGSKGESE